MISVELFYHCDAPNCTMNTYIPGDVVTPGQDVVKLPKDIPAGWRVDEGYVYCKEHA